MIKKRKKSKLLSVFICLLIVAVFSSYAYVSVDASGNITDTLFEYNGSANYAITDPRTKMDYTSCYAYNDTSHSIDAVRIHGCVIYNQDVVDYQDCTYGSVLQLPGFTQKYFPNTVKEYGFYYARLQFTVNSSGNKYIHVWWSPDSV